MSDSVARLNTALEGRYRIESELGEGGMAMVYLADDLKHDRKVAIKVLKPELAAVVGAERFLAEIKTTANLQHPNILPLFDSGHADSFVYYVMPYVEGESLQDKLKRERQLPVEEAVGIANEVADALQAAHEAGVVHRDIKPANILLSRGRPLVADFGIALAVTGAAGTRLTETGLSVGTPHYMSPEQATGEQHVGPAADTYALGCVLYEMLVGEPPYMGATAQAILGRIIMGGPASATEHRPSVPAHVDGAIRKALEKLPADRFTSVREFAGALGDPSFRYREGTARTGARTPATRTWSVAATLVAMVSTSALVVSLIWPRGDGPTARAIRFTIPVGDTTEVYLGGEEDAFMLLPSVISLAISPDGNLVVYAAWKSEPGGEAASQLYLRRLDQKGGDPIPDTEGAYGPFFSPDGNSIGFHVEGALKRLSVADGSVETITQLEPTGVELGPGSITRITGATWGDDNTIVFVLREALFAVAASGGEADLISAVDSAGLDFAHFQVDMLPGSGKLLVSGKPHRTSSFEESGIFVLDVPAGSLTRVLSNATNPHYVATGQLLFVRQGTLMAVGFDPDRGEVEGQPRIVLESVMQALGMPASYLETGLAQLSVSLTGHLIYALGGVYPSSRNALMRVTMDGTEEALGLDSLPYNRVHASPDGDRFVFTAGQQRGLDIYVHDVARRFTQQLPTGGFRSSRPHWSPDGLSIAFQSDRDGEQAKIYRITADGRGEPERLTSSDQDEFMMDWSSEGVIAYRQNGDIWMLPRGEKPGPFFRSDAMETHATFSPDGRWLAYRSSQEDVGQVYVRPYPGPGGAARISDGNNATSPAWSPDGGQLFFLALGRGSGLSDADPHRMMVVDVFRGDELSPSAATLVIDPWLYGAYAPTRGYDVLADGSFIVQKSVALRQEAVEELHVILNFFEVLKERVGN